jgi:hypothetical protein
VVAIALLCLWGLSPLASQGLQYMLYTTPRTISGQITDIRYINMTYVNPEFAGQRGGGSVESGTNNANGMDLLFAAALVPRGILNTTGEDPYRLPLIPALHLLDTWKASDCSSDGWYDTPRYMDDSGPPSYASLYGIATENPTQKDNPTQPWGINGGTAKFVVHTSYWRFNCTGPVNRTWTDVLADSPSLDAVGSRSGTLFIDMYPPVKADTTADGRYENYTGNGWGKLEFASVMPATGTKGEDDYIYNKTVAYAKCGMNQTFVDAELLCISDHCVVDRMRVANTPAYVVPTAKFHIGLLRVASGTYVSPVELWLNDASSVLSGDFRNPDLTKLSQPIFEQRLAVLLNTYWHLGFSANMQVGMEDFSRESPTATADWTSDPAWYFEINLPWLIVVIICSVILIAAGVTIAWFEHHTIGPDILGFASSIVRQSKYISVPKGTSGESGAERARRMKDHKVMMQDVRPSGEVGKIALGTALETSVPLKPGKLYR